MSADLEVPQLPVGRRVQVVDAGGRVERAGRPDADGRGLDGSNPLAVLLNRL